MRYKPGNKITCYLDSGAFSAWTKQVEIDIDEYAAFVKKHRHLFDYVFNLDKIPGKRGERTKQQLDEAAAQSYKNWHYLKKLGVDTIPVFHQGEDLRWLKKMIDDGAGYIGISTKKPQATVNAALWLDRVFEFLCDKDGYPRVQTHGLGVASFDLLKRYPWTTCDAVSWALTASFGAVLVPRYVNGKPDYLQEPAKIIMSDRERKGQEQDGSSLFDFGTTYPSVHFRSLGKFYQARVIDFLTKHVGTTVERVINSYEERAMAVVYVFVQFEKVCNVERFELKSTPGFVSGAS